MRSETTSNANQQPETSLGQQGTKKRLASLDAFRGLTIMLMILVNNPGSWGHVYGPLRHAQWHGCTMTDLVFPFFLFIVGSAMYFSFAKSNFELTPSVVVHILKRTVILFVIGLLLQAMASYTYSSEFRIMGVLQRIALAYGAAALIVLMMRGRWAIPIVSLGLLLMYWGLLYWMGGDVPYSLEGNVVRTVDLQIMGAQRMYSVDGVAFDPEGLLSTIPSVVSVLIGFETTRLLRLAPNRSWGLLVLAAVGLAMVTVGLAWGNIWPVSKSLWTGSFVVLTSGWAMVVLSVLMWLMDVQGLKLQPLQAFGLNPLFLYILAWVWMLSYWLIPVGDGKLFPVVFGIFLGGDEPSKASSFLFAVCHVGIFWIIAQWLYRKRVVIKV